MKSKTMKIQFVVLCMDRDFLFFFHYITTVAKNCFSLICVYFFLQFFSLTTKEKAWCVDPRAWWLPNRLKKLERVSQTQSVLSSIMFTWIL